MTTNFSVTITDGNGCQQVLSTIVFLNTSCNPKDVEIPNIFTPNGDGLNDTFGAVIIDGLEDVELMEVWNRWGKLVFEGTGKAARWDGMVDGEPAPSDVYLYKIIVTCSGNDDEIMIGDITLMR